MGRLKFKLVPNSGVGATANVTTYRPVHLSSGVLDLYEIANLICDKCSATQSDVISIVYAVANELRRGLEDGFTVDLHQLGRYSLSLHANGELTDMEETVNQQIAVNKINYRPADFLIQNLAYADRFERVRTEERPTIDSATLRQYQIMQYSQDKEYVNVTRVRKLLRVGTKTAHADLAELVAQGKMEQMQMGSQTFFIPKK
ncbi:MAG: DeoR family transcriptional regulator [Bacteroidales bacterium]